MTPEAKDLIENMLKLDENERITKNGSEALRNHVFFSGIDWENLRTIAGPIIPQRKIEENVTTKNFNEQEKNNPFFKAPSDNTLNKCEVFLIMIFIYFFEKKRILECENFSLKPVFHKFDYSLKFDKLNSIIQKNFSQEKIRYDLLRRENILGVKEYANVQMERKETGSLLKSRIFEEESISEEDN